MNGTIRTDAERYRYLRDHCLSCEPSADGEVHVITFRGGGRDIAAAIDAALEPETPAETAVAHD